MKNEIKNQRSVSASLKDNKSNKMKNQNIKEKENITNDKKGFHHRKRSSSYFLGSYIPDINLIENNYEEEHNINIDNVEKENNENEKDKNNFSNSLGIKWEPLIKEYRNYNSENKKYFSIFFQNEYDFIISNITLDKGIAKNRILKENIFLQFITITSNIPLIIIGKPGSSKSLSFQLLKKTMRGNYSKSDFFRKYPQTLTTYFQCSESTLPEDI